MQPFKFQQNLPGRKIDTEMHSKTGFYAGGSVETRTSTTTENGRTSTSTSQYETVNVRTPDGKVVSVVKDGTANIPQGSAITIFYTSNKDYYHPLAFYVHDSERLHYLGKSEIKRAKRDLMNQGFLKSVWSKLMNLLAIIFGAGITWFLVAFINVNMRPPEWTLWVGGFILWFLASHLCAFVTDRLGGTLRSSSPLETALEKAMFAEAENIERSFASARQQAQSSETTVHLGGGSIGGSIGGSPAPSAKEPEDFKPMF